MIELEEAQDLINKFVDLRNSYNETKDSLIYKKMKNQENICIKKFKYLVTMKTNRYKSFSNYEDLNQEGMEALVKSMRNYNPDRGIFFWWAHKYIDTRISRSANLHTTIRFPLKVAKLNAPHKETLMPMLIEENYCPDKELEQSQTEHAIQSVTNLLTDEQKEMINLAYGMSGEKPMSINKICKKLNISRLHCIKALNSSLLLMREHIKI